MGKRLEHILEIVLPIIAALLILSSSTPVNKYDKIENLQNVKYTQPYAETQHSAETQPIR